MGINRETKRAMEKDLRENPELYEALADVDEDETDDADDE